MRATFAAAGMLAALPIFAALQDTHTITWNPVQGEKTKYKIEVDGQMDIPGAGQMAMHVEMMTEGTVKEVTDEKVTITGKMVDMKILLDGNDITEMAGGSESMGKESTTVFTRRGEMLSTSVPTEGANSRFERMSNFVYPDKALAVDEEWTQELKADKEKNLPAARTKYTFKGLEEVSGKKYQRVDFAFSELEGDTKMGAMGTFWLEPNTGKMFRTKADVNDAQLAPEMPPSNVKLLVQLQ